MKIKKKLTMKDMPGNMRYVNELLYKHVLYSRYFLNTEFTYKVNKKKSFREGNTRDNGRNQMAYEYNA